MFVNEHPVTPKHAKMRGDKSPIYPPLTPLPSRGDALPQCPPVNSSAVSRILAAGGSGLRSSLSRSNSGATKVSPAAAAPAATDKPHIAVDSNRYFATNTNNGSKSTHNSSNTHSSAASCGSGQHRDRLARLTAEIQRGDQQQLRLTGVSVTLAVGLFYLLLERMALKQLSLTFSFAAYIPFLHVLPALCAMCIIWLRLPTCLPPATAPSPISTVGSPAATNCPVTLEDELLQKYMSTWGLGVVRQSQQVHRRVGSCLLKFLVCLAASDFFAAYVQFWPLLHLPKETRASLSTAVASPAARPPVFGPPPPGVYREGFERYPPESVHLLGNSGILNSNSSSSTFLLSAQRVAAVLMYLLRVLAAVWVLTAANAMAPGPQIITADEQEKQQQPRGEHSRKWLRSLESLPGGVYTVQKLYALNTLLTRCCSRGVAKQMFFGLFPAFLLFQVWLMPLSPQKPSGLLSSFSRRATTSNYMLVVGLLGLATLQLLMNALLPFVNDLCLPVVRKLRNALALPPSRFFPPSSSSAAPSPSPRSECPPVQRASRFLFVAALLLEIFNTIVGVRAVFYLFMDSGLQSQPLASAEAVSQGERILICTAAVAHTLAAFVFASAGACCGLQNYLISKIFSDGRIVEHEVLGRRDQSL